MRCETRGLLAGTNDTSQVEVLLPRALTEHCVKTQADDSIDQKRSITIHTWRRLARWDQSEQAQDLSIQDPERPSQCGINPNEPKIYRYKIPNERGDGLGKW